MRLYRAICAYLEAITQAMSDTGGYETRDTTLDAMVERSGDYTTNPEMHAGYRPDSYGYMRGRIGFQRASHEPD